MGNIQTIVEIIDGNCLAAQIKLTESLPMKKERKPKSCNKYSKSENLFSVFNSPKISNSVIKKSALSKRQTRPKLQGSNLQSIPEVELFTNDLIASESQVNKYVKSSEFDNFCQRASENNSLKKKKRKINNENLDSDNFDILYPDSITPEKIRKYFSNELNFELPFIDDLKFFEDEWYIGSDNIWLYIPTDIPVSINNSAKIHRRKSSSGSSSSSGKRHHSSGGGGGGGRGGLLKQLLGICCKR